LPNIHQGQYDKNMIRLFTALCKSLLDKISEEQAFLSATREFNPYGAGCPICGAAGKLSDYGSYERNHVTITDGIVVDSRANPRRVKCLSCGATHALLPDTLTPYSPYTLQFKLLVLVAHFERDTTVVSVCGRFAIAVSTLYEWKKLMAAHKDFMLGVLVSRKTPALAFLRGLLNSADISATLHGFFHKYGFSFMQGTPVSAALSVPP
jgi:hypothetical protein